MDIRRTLFPKKQKKLKICFICKKFNLENIGNHRINPKRVNQNSYNILIFRKKTLKKTVKFNFNIYKLKLTKNCKYLVQKVSINQIFKHTNGQIIFKYKDRKPERYIYTN